MTYTDRRIVAITIVCLIGGPWAVWHGFSVLLADSRAKAWPTTPGVITVLDVTAKQGTKGGVTYEPVIKYRYGVGEKHFRNDRVDFGRHGTSSVEEAARFAARYQLEQEVPVHYDPTDPQSAVLEVGSHSSAWLDIAAGLGFTAIALFSCWSGWQELHSGPFKTANGF